MSKRKAKRSDVQPLQNGVSHFTFLPTTQHLPDHIREKHSLQFYIRRVKKWLKTTPRFRLNIKYSFLEDRSNSPRNTEDLINAAKKKIDEMREWPADPYSGIFQTSEGVPVLAVYAQTAPTEKGELHEAEKGSGAAGGSYYDYTVGPEGHPGRTVDVEPRATPYDPDVHHDGFLTKDVELANELAQELHASMQPVLNKRDVRHTDDKGPTHAFTFGNGNGGEVRRCEKRGVTHLVHAWHAQCFEHEPLVPSADIMGRHGALRFVEVMRYFQLSMNNALRLKAYFKMTFPEYYAAYQEAFEAGVWLRVDPGPWLGKAVVFKLQVTPHVDGKDDGPTACYPTGYFSGGEAYFPDLGIKLAYRPKDIIIFLSGHLYHAVGTWVSTRSPREADGLTPGRVGHVHFFHRSALEVLRGKPSGWMLRTCGGKYKDTYVAPPYEAPVDDDDDDDHVHNTEINDDSYNEFTDTNADANAEYDRYNYDVGYNGEEFVEEVDEVYEYEEGEIEEERSSKKLRV